MKPFDSIETPETRLGSAGLTRRLPASESGAPFPLLPCQPPGKVARFVREAEARSRQGSHGRAAIAFRTLAEQARLQGLAEQCDQLLGRAAAAYTHAAGEGLL
jgi:hypothetical protein